MATSPSRLGPTVSFGRSCCGPASPVDIVPAPLSADDAPAEVSSTDYQIAGMTYGSCAAQVTDALHALPQVDAVAIALAAGGVSTVTVAGGGSSEAVRRAIEQAGYSLIDS